MEKKIIERKRNAVNSCPDENHINFISNYLSAFIRICFCVYIYIYILVCVLTISFVSGEFLTTNKVYSNCLPQMLPLLRVNGKWKPRNKLINPNGFPMLTFLFLSLFLSRFTRKSMVIHFIIAQQTQDRMKQKAKRESPSLFFTN